MNLTRATIAMICVAALTTCATSRDRDPDPALRPPSRTEQRVATVRAAQVPQPAAHALLPSAASVRGGALPADALAAIDRCSVCHADVFEQWSASAHRFSSMDNPFYSASFQATREQRGAATTRWCGGCHDPALLFAGDLDGAPIDRTHERAQLGVGCVLCHSIETVHDRTGNANYVLSPDPIPMPRRAGESFTEVQPHVARVMSAVLRTGEFCGACHKVGITEAVNQSHWLRGQNDFDAWDQSAYAGNNVERHDPGVREQSCQDCHMPMEPALHNDAAASNGMVRSHRFVGGHTALAAWNGNSEMLARQRAMLENVVRVDLFTTPEGNSGATPIERSPVIRGGALRLDVVLVNERVGHNFPGGTADVADTWLEITVHDAAGRTLAESGVMDASGAVAADAHRLETRPIDDQGAPARLRDPHRYRALAYDTTLPPRAARVVRYSFDPPGDAPAPYSVRARLLHRRIAEPYWSFACARAPGDLGRACPTAPVTEIARVESMIGASVRASAPQPALWQRYYDHGRALGEVIVQERVAQARASLLTALEGSPDAIGPMVELARVSVREGRTEEAYARLDEARVHGPNAPVIAYMRAMAGTDVWRFGETLEPLLALHAAVPRNVRATEMLANALGLAGRHAEAYAVINDGLRVDPERAQLRNLQALELDSLGEPDEAARARDAYLRFRAPDEAPGLRSRCKRDVPGCAREAEPVHVHALHAPRRGSDSARSFHASSSHSRSGLLSATMPPPEP